MIWDDYWSQIEFKKYSEFPPFKWENLGTLKADTGTSAGKMSFGDWLMQLTGQLAQMWMQAQTYKSAGNTAQYDALIAQLRQQYEQQQKSTLEKYVPLIIIGGCAMLGLMALAIIKK